MKIRKIVTGLLMLVVTVSCCTVSTYAAELPDQRVFSCMRATGHFDMEVSGNSTVKANTEFPLEIGETVAINAVYSPQTASVDFGLLAPDGLFYALNTTDGSFDEVIEVDQRGNYTLVVRNNSDYSINVSGYVNY
ncbi:hypothetical protein [uncultured Subdoligranulum sp.]|uniref:hypothetical protein n=1 Tax=uncultured Subdoligranulum sp. TaxID=512298 RepID=UPI0026163BE0|nr:hypothetical protein [uncultured Subdoligranulum sp.]